MAQELMTDHRVPTWKRQLSISAVIINFPIWGVTAVAAIFAGTKHFAGPMPLYLVDLAIFVMATLSLLGVLLKGWINTVVVGMWICIAAAGLLTFWVSLLFDHPGGLELGIKIALASAVSAMLVLIVRIGDV